MNDYYSCDFDSYRPTVKLRFRRSPYQIEGQFGREYIYYNNYFTEYDSEGIFWGFTGSYNMPFDLNLSLGYLYKVSDNIGFNQNDQAAIQNPVEDAEYGDSSYEEDRYLVKANYKLPFKSPWDWDVGVDYQRRMRFYQSQLSCSDDPFHAGREDVRTIITPGVKFSSSFDIDFEFSFTYDQRKTDSPEPVVPSIKNFIHRTFELTVTYQIF